ncbi:hypothetical protein OSTOST_24166, partial [Ostertagia ostertagi]
MFILQFFSEFDIVKSSRYRQDVIQRGEVGGNCAKFDAEVLKENQNERGYLRSWSSDGIGTFSGGFVDSWFGDTWKVFTDAQPVELTALAGRRVCFKNAMFPLLARQSFGLYYNTPLETDCHGTGLMHAFAHHVLHRLGIHQKGPLLDNVRVTILSRSTKFRRILNLDE